MLQPAFSDCLLLDLLSHLQDLRTSAVISIAAVVLGGTSLLGGVGGAIGSVIGACLLRLISFYFRIFDIEPLLQPLIEGVILLSAVSLGAIHVLRVKNRLELFK